MNTLPMADDLRLFSFPTFDVIQRPQGAPTAVQLAAARSLVRDYDLTAGPRSEHSSVHGLWQRAGQGIESSFLSGAHALVICRPARSVIALLLF